ncbi:MAG: BrnA antitoxin family protein [Burkholderiales bacterium]
MKRANTSPKFTTLQIKAAIKAAPAHVNHPDSPYDPNDAKAVAGYFKDAVGVHGGGYQAVKAALAAKRKPGPRGPGKRPPKEVINIRLSPEVLSAFRATGDGWQTRVDGALRDWLKGHEPRTIKARRVVDEA